MEIKKLYLPKFNTIVVDYAALIENYTRINFQNDFEFYCTDNKFNKTAKRLLVHHVLKDTIEYALRFKEINRHHELILYYFRTELLEEFSSRSSVVIFEN